MQPISLRGGTTVAAGVYREMRSGRLVYLSAASALPGQSNSEQYVQVPQAALFNHRRQYLANHARAVRERSRA